MSRRNKYFTRDPEPVSRDPEPEQTVTQERKPRRYIPASMPVVCPECGGATRMADGRHMDPVKRTVLEYRTCARCGIKLAAGRPMVAHEVSQHCQGFEAAVAEYQQAGR